MAGDVLVIAEHEGGKVDSITFEVITKGRQLADTLGSKLMVLLLGAETASLGGQLGGRGVDAVVTVDSPKLSPYTPEAYTQATFEAAKQTAAGLILFGHTYRGIETAPAVASRLGAPFASNCVGLDIKNGAPLALRPVFQGVMRSRVTIEGPQPWVATIQKGAFAEKACPERTVEVIPLKVDIPDPRVKVIGMLKPPEGDIDITKADIIVAVGRGIKDKNNIKAAEDLARALGGVVACSRPVSDMGWLPSERHVGMSGKTVSPRVYLALGISGSSQHVAGIRDSQVIIAVNKDANAPIFRNAHYGVIADMFEIMPALTQEANKAK